MDDYTAKLARAEKRVPMGAFDVDLPPGRQPSTPAPMAAMPPSRRTPSAPSPGTGPTRCGR
jgi:hypothetical protein